MGLKQDLSMQEADTFILDATVTDQGNPVDLTGGTLYFTAKLDKADSDANAVFQKSTGSGIVATDPINGVARITVDPVDTKDKISEFFRGKRELCYDFQFVSVSGQSFTITYGELLVRQQITQA